MIKNVVIPNYLKKGVIKNHRGYHSKVNILAGDVETFNGEPYLLCLKKDKPDLLEVDKDSCEEKFVDWLWHHSNYYKKEYAMNVILFHNLLFDLSAIFINHHRKFGLREFYIFGEFEHGKYCVNLNIGDCVFGTIYFSKVGELKKGNKENRYRKTGITKKVELRDSFSFFNTSLKKISEDLNLEHKKFDRPEDLGTKKLMDKEFLDYSEQDVLTQYDLNKYIVDLHKDYDIKLCVSIAQMASRIFKHKFMEKENILTFPTPYECQRFSELSYHGGKNGFYLENPQMINDVYEVDVNSMYPYAMNNIPNFNGCEYEYVDSFDNNRNGVYCVSGFVEDNKYSIIANHDFNYFNNSYINDICLTSFELREALKQGLFSMDSCSGYIVEEKEKFNPLKEYVKYFYEKKKNTNKNNNKYIFYKVMLNALYGKFQQTTETYAEEVLKDMKGFKEKPHKLFEWNLNSDTIIEYPTVFKAGGLYSPMISSLITGFARTYLFQLENKYSALDSSTDSIKTLIKPKGLNKELGGLSIKNYGDCLFFRNKFYVHFGDLISYAKHGCQASLEDIVGLWINKEHEYNFERMTKVRESLRRSDIVPLTKQKFTSFVNIDYLENPSPRTLEKAKRMQKDLYQRKIDEIDSAFTDSSLTEDELNEPTMKDLQLWEDMNI